MDLEWHLSGHPVTNSSNRFISEERLNSTGLRSSITLHQSLTHTSTLQCVGSNTHGTARKLFQLPPPVTRVRRVLTSADFYSTFKVASRHKSVDSEEDHGA